MTALGWDATEVVVGGASWWLGILGSEGVGIWGSEGVGVWGSE